MFYAPAPDKSGLQGYEIGVVEHLSDGDKRVRLQLGLRQTSSESSDNHSAYDMPSRAGVSRDSMSLLGLLHLLWTEAGLNRWHPAMQGKRSISRIGYWVLEQAKQIRVSRMVLSDVMLLHAKSGQHEAQRNQTVSTNAKAKGLRLIAVDALAKFDADKYQMPLARLPMSGPAGMPFSYISKALWERTEKRFARELNVWKSGAGRVIAIAQIEVKDSGKNAGRVCDLALMAVSGEWIPLDSSYEAAVEEALREQGRSFFKPLRYDAGEDCVFPDFWLLDVGQDFPMEVFGMNTAEYLARKAEKTAYYNSKYGHVGWWSWDVAQSSNFNGFPERGSFMTKTNGGSGDPAAVGDC